MHLSKQGASQNIKHYILGAIANDGEIEQIKCNKIR